MQDGTRVGTGSVQRVQDGCRVSADGFWGAEWVQGRCWMGSGMQGGCRMGSGVQSECRMSSGRVQDGCRMGSGVQDGF